MRICAYMSERRESGLTPCAPWICIASSITSRAQRGAATLIIEMYFLASLNPFLSAMVAAG